MFLENHNRLCSACPRVLNRGAYGAWIYSDCVIGRLARRLRKTLARKRWKVRWRLFVFLLLDIAVYNLRYYLRSCDAVCALYLCRIRIHATSEIFSVDLRSIRLFAMCRINVEPSVLAQEAMQTPALRELEQEASKSASLQIQSQVIVIWKRMTCCSIMKNYFALRLTWNGESWILNFLVQWFLHSHRFLTVYIANQFALRSDLFLSLWLRRL